MKLNTRSILERLTGGQKELLQRYASLLAEKAIPLGLISGADADRLWERHVLDSLRGVACADPVESSAFDVGSGAGLPGVPLAIALPGIRFTLIEPKQRRAAFLELVAETLGLPNTTVASVQSSEISTKTRLCLARALGSPVESWRAASSLLEEGGRLLYWAGRTWGDAAGQLAGLGVHAKICLEHEFQWQGPLVIMTRFSTESPR
ncbi:MAG: 16S rRNA (guanine(527)-N(7))-methyltransferase RsmG [Actinomycetota bacterium]